MFLFLCDVDIDFFGNGIEDDKFVLFDLFVLSDSVRLLVMFFVFLCLLRFWIGVVKV